jgi:hypothetical protein
VCLDITDAPEPLCDHARMARALRRAAILGALSALVFALWKVAQRHHDERGVEWEASPFPFPPVPRPTEATSPSAGGTAKAPWVEPNDGSCPASHPVKAKLGSGIFHVPGGASYERTKADRCYCDADAAQRDGLRAAKA